MLGGGVSCQPICDAFPLLLQLLLIHPFSVQHLIMCCPVWFSRILVFFLSVSITKCGLQTLLVHAPSYPAFWEGGGPFLPVMGGHQGQPLKSDLVDLFPWSYLRLLEQSPRLEGALSVLLSLPREPKQCPQEVQAGCHVKIWLKCRRQFLYCRAFAGPCGRSPWKTGHPAGSSRWALQRHTAWAEGAGSHPPALSQDENKGVM